MTSRSGVKNSIIRSHDLAQPHVHPYLRPSVHCWSCLSSGRLSRLSFYAFESCHLERTPSDMIQSWFLLRRSSSLQVLQFGCLLFDLALRGKLQWLPRGNLSLENLVPVRWRMDWLNVPSLHLYQPLVFLKRRRRGCIGVMNGLLINVSNWKVVILLNCCV